MENEVSRTATFEDLLKLSAALNENNAEYFLIGGYALFAHGFYRTTTDIDLLIKPDRISGEKIRKALLILPDKSAEGIKPEWFEEGETIRLADEIVVDIMFNAAGETYETLKKYLEIMYLEGIPVRTLNLEGLLLTKKTLREKDIADRRVLEKALEISKKIFLRNR